MKYFKEALKSKCEPSRWYCHRLYGRGPITKQKLGYIVKKSAKVQT